MTKQKEIVGKLKELTKFLTDIKSETKKFQSNISTIIASVNNPNPTLRSLNEQIHNADLILKEIKQQNDQFKNGIV